MTAPDRLADPTDPRFTDAQRAIVARFEAAVTPPEVVEARVVEDVARAMYGAAGHGAPSWRPMWDDLDEVREQTWLTLAAAAVAAYRAAQDGGAEEAVRRVEALHAPFGIYTECECDHTEDDIENDLAFEVMEVGITCEDGLMYRVCLSCCTGNGYQTEECVTNHEHGKDEPICPTVAALAPQAEQ